MVAKMRKFGKVDENQNRIVQTLRDYTASVQSLASVGNGCPDLLVCYHGFLYLMEVKDGEKPPSQRKLTAAETNWIGSWGGTVHIVNSPQEALQVIGVVK